jgi:protein SCO1
MNRSLTAILTLLCLLTITSIVAAEGMYNQREIGSLNKPASAPYTPEEVMVDQSKRGSTIPLDTKWVDETGKDVTLADYFTAGRPVVLNLGYYECPMLCGIMNQRMVENLKSLPLDLGTEFMVVNISVDPNENWPLARDKKATYMKTIGKPGNAAGWHLLVGGPESIKSLTEALGYRYKKIDNEIAHPSALIIVSPTGTITQYLDAMLLDTGTTRLALVEASQGKLGSIWDRIILTCFHFDPSTGKYTKLAIGLMQAAGAVTIIVFFSIMIPLWIKSVKKTPTKVSPQTA